MRGLVVRASGEADAAAFQEAELHWQLQRVLGGPYKGRRVGEDAVAYSRPGDPATVVYLGIDFNENGFPTGNHCDVPAWLEERLRP